MSRSVNITSQGQQRILSVTIDGQTRVLNVSTGVGPPGPPGSIESAVIVSDTAPINPEDGSGWLDSTTGIVSYWDEAQQVWVAIPPTGETSVPVELHAETHATGGTDEISPSDIGALDATPAAVQAQLAAEPAEARAAMGASPIAFISVKDFGAVGNGVANDTTAIQNAVAAAKAAKVAIFVPAGDYLIDGTIVLDWESAVIEGVSAGIGGSRIITTSTTEPVISLPGDYNFVRIANLKIIGPGRTTATQPGINIRGDLVGGSNVDFGLIQDCWIEGFDVGIYWRGVANSSIERAGILNCRIGIHSLGNNNSNTFQNCAFVCSNGVIAGTIGVYLAAGRGTLIEACDFGGPTLEWCVVDGAVSTVVIGGNWEAYGSGLKTEQTTSLPVISGVAIAQFGTASDSRYSFEFAVGGTIIGGQQSIINTTNGAAIRSNSTISRAIRYFGGSGTIKADFFTGGTTYNHTANVGGGIGVMTQASGESASANTLGISWLRESPGSNLVYNFGVRNAAGDFAWANLLDFHFLKEAAASNPAFLGSANTFTASQAISNSTAPLIKIHTGTDTQQQRFTFGIATASAQFVTGTVANDSCIVARSGGNLLFAVGATSTNQIIAGRFKASGRFNLSDSAVPNYADDTAADAALASGDLYTTTEGGRTVFRKP
jgi:hypothetical protein